MTDERNVPRSSAATPVEPVISVRDMSGCGEGPWRLMVNGHGCADWPWNANEHNPEDYAEEVARVVRKGLRSSKQSPAENLNKRPAVDVTAAKEALADLHTVAMGNDSRDADDLNRKFMLIDDALDDLEPARESTGERLERLGFEKPQAWQQDPFVRPRASHCAGPAQREPFCCASCGHTWTTDTLWCPECQRKRQEVAAGHKASADPHAALVDAVRDMADEFEARGSSCIDTHVRRVIACMPERATPMPSAAPCIMCCASAPVFCEKCAADITANKGPFPATYEAHGVNVAAPSSSPAVDAVKRCIRIVERTTVDCGDIERDASGFAREVLDELRAYRDQLAAPFTCSAPKEKP